MVTYLRTYFDYENTRVVYIQDYDDFNKNPKEILFEKAKYEKENGVDLIMDLCEDFNFDTVNIEFIAKSPDSTRPEHLVRNDSMITAIKWARIGFEMLQHGEVAESRYEDQCDFMDNVDYYATLYYTVYYKQYMDLESFTELDDVDYTSMFDEYRYEIARINLGGQDYD